MDRNEFLRKCQLASAFKYDNSREELFVKFGGVEYFPYSYEIGFIDGTPIHRALLRDLNCNSVVATKLQDIE